MQFTHVTIENFGIIRGLELDFRPGINGIVGPNGSGKSTVLDALCLLTTGVSRGGGKSADNLTWGEKRGSLHGDFVHGGSPYSITRAVGKRSCPVFWTPLWTPFFIIRLSPKAPLIPFFLPRIPKDSGRSNRPLG